jgi:hypothetical protein
LLGTQDGEQYATFGIILGWVHIAFTCYHANLAKAARAISC